MDCKTRVLAKVLCHARPTRSSWPLKQRQMGNISQIEDPPQHKIISWQREIYLNLNLKLMRSVWAAHVRTPKQNEFAEETVCEPLQACLCYI